MARRRASNRETVKTLRGSLGFTSPQIASMRVYLGARALRLRSMRLAMYHVHHTKLVSARAFDQRDSFHIMRPYHNYTRLLTFEVGKVRIDNNFLGDRTTESGRQPKLVLMLVQRLFLSCP